MFHVAQERYVFTQSGRFQISVFRNTKNLLQPSQIQTQQSILKHVIQIYTVKTNLSKMYVHVFFRSNPVSQAVISLPDFPLNFFKNFSSLTCIIHEPHLVVIDLFTLITFCAHPGGHPSRKTYRLLKSQVRIPVRA